MTLIDNLIAAFFILQFLFLLLTDISLIKKGIEKGMKNILILGIGMAIVTLAIFLVILGSSFDDVQDLYNVGILFILIFTYATFYRKLHSNFRIYLTLSLLMFVIKIFSYNVFEEEGVWFYVDTLAQTFLVLIVVGYYASASLRAYQIVKNQPVKPHVKKRLQIMGYGSWFAVIGNLPIWIMEIVLGTPYDELEYGSAFVILLVTITSATFAVCMYLSWVMPNWFKEYLNRGYEDSDVVEVDDDAIFGVENEAQQEEGKEEKKINISSTNEMITYLANLLMDTTGMSVIVANGALRYAIKDSLGTIPSNVRFREWLIILDEHLRTILENQSVKNAESVCGVLITDLIQKQSLITMINL